MYGVQCFHEWTICFRVSYVLIFYINPKLFKKYPIEILCPKIVVGHYIFSAHCLYLVYAVSKYPTNSTCPFVPLLFTSGDSPYNSVPNLEMFGQKLLVTVLCHMTP
jgi:hypothetical protein